MAAPRKTGRKILERLMPTAIDVDAHWEMISRGLVWFAFEGVLDAGRH